MTQEPVRRGGASTVRTFSAPTRAEAEALARTTINAFVAAGWRSDEQLWIPGDRRPSLTESLLLSTASENLLDADGTLRITFVSDAADAVPPEVSTPVRAVDEFESLAGTRYRRLAARWIVDGVAAIIGLIWILSMAGSLPGFATPTPDANGMCPLGFGPGWVEDANGNVTSTFCSRLTN
ncbi:MAG: hypothetical protein EPO00_04860 [Chloroflexota bacterium]|nr:MAG: hypothetical protein EPO00_04860 [Chloroflexota bacterium]